MPAQDELTGSFADPASSLNILLVDANSSSRANITSLFQKYNYQVTSCKTSQEAIRILEAHQRPGGTSGFDLILKEHSPAQGTNACRLLRKAQTEAVLKGIPIVVVSTTEDRDVMVSCLQLGAADYMIKPLRHNEVRNLWARVYWWRRASYLQQQPAGSVLPGDFAPLPSNGSVETKGSEEGKEEGALDEDSGEGSAPNGSGSLRHGSNGSGSKELGSKGDSKGAAGWSGTQPKPAGGGEAFGVAAGGQGNGTSATNQACQGSNHPSSDAAATANGGTTPGSLAPRPMAGGEGTGLRIAPLDLTTKPSTSRPLAVSPRADAERRSNSAEAAPGFRAYVSSGNPRKRSADRMENAEFVTAPSSGSDRTQSLDNAFKRRDRSASRMDSGSAGVATSDDTFNLPGVCNPAGGSNPGSSGMADPANPNPAHGQSGSGSCAPMNQGQVNGFGGYYPFGMMTPFTVPPQFWSQMSGGQMGGQGGNTDMTTMFSQFSHQAQNQQGRGMNMSQGQQQQQQQQQQQVAMHNQLMMQHSMLIQQCGMPAPPFVSFQNLNRAMANQASQSYQASQPQPHQQSQQGGQQGSNAQSRRCGAPLPVSSHSPAPVFHGGSGSGRETPSEAGKRGTPHHWSSGMPRAHSMPASGMATGNGTSNAAGNTLGSAPGNATGATSHASAQLGVDGSLVEPSRQERRAQALHKYKQKRKNLNFTKKIRYESRKQLAQARPRVKGQFVRLQPEEEDVSDPLDEDIPQMDETPSPRGEVAVGDGTAPDTHCLIKPEQLSTPEEASPMPASSPSPQHTEKGAASAQPENCSSIPGPPKMSSLMAASHQQFVK